MAEIALVGMMGAGKSEIGKRAANVLGLAHVDMDQEFEARYGPIKSFFSSKGEEEFRRYESELLKELAGRKGIVLSTGGGVVENEENVRILEKMTTVYLFTPPAILWERVKNSERPLAQDKDIFFSIFKKRRSRYELFRKVDVSKLSPWEATARVIMTVFKGFYSVEEEYNIFQNVRISSAFSLPKADLNIVSKKVKKIWRIEGKAFKDGESLKNILGIERMWKTFLDHDLDRSSNVNFIGGGTLTDCGGFAAQTFKRGIGFSLIPTTLLGMVDASLGGKVAVNFESVKNVIGTFARPNVFINPLFSVSLMDETFKEGIVEALKVGVVYDRELFEYIEENLSSILKRNIFSVTKMISKSVKDKLEIVKMDPYDQKIRHLLNFGHTIGHAIESASGNSISHGRAVAVGMVKESSLFGKTVEQRLRTLIGKLDFNDDIPDYQVLKKWILKDKKRERGKISMPVVEEVGKAHVETVDFDTLFP